MRPILGGVFGDGRYALATTMYVANGLHSVRFMVIDPVNGTVYSIADDKTQALAAAREMLRASEQVAEHLEDQWSQTELWAREELPIRPIVDKHRPVSRRRRDIFEKCR